MTLRTTDKWHDMEQLYGQFYERLVVYAFGFLSSKEEASDVVSGVMEQIWNDWQADTPRYPSPNAPLLYSLVRNRCLDILRHGKAHDRYTSLFLATADMTTTMDVDAFEERVSKLQAAIAQLSDADRDVLRCTYFEHMTYKETAAALDISENAVHKRMVRAFRTLRKMLKFIVTWYILVMNNV